MNLNAQQRRAVEYAGPAKHLLVLAGAGTGKTRTLIARVLHLIRQGVAPNRILLLTFTRRAANEMVTRLAQDLGTQAEQVFAGTFHRFCLAVMRKLPEAFELEQVRIIDQDEALSLVQMVRGEFLDRDEVENVPKSDDIQALISFAKNSCISVAEYLDRFTSFRGPVAAAIIEIARQFEIRKRQRNYLDFDDILYRFAESLERYPRLRQRLSERLQHIAVDEFQDTNPLQYRILKALSASSLFCVGDDAQSIYSFRGADFHNVHSFRDRFPNSEVIKLVENYRSYQDILDLSNWVLDQSPLQYDKKLVGARGRGAKPILREFGSRFAEAEWIAKDILRRRQEGARWSDIMILGRTGWSCRTVETACITANIPYVVIGGTSLLESAHVKDVLALVRAVMSPRDELAWIRYLKCWPKIGDKTAKRYLDQLISTYPNRSLPEAFEQILPNRREVTLGVRSVYECRSNPEQAVQQAIECLTPLMREKYDRWAVREADLKLLLQLASQYQSLAAFLDAYTLDPMSATEAEHQGDPDVVSIMTVHSAKGAEAPVCYCVAMQPGHYPHQRSIGNPSAEEEERRVLYVALTRAQNELILTRSPDSGTSSFLNVGDVDEDTVVYLLENLPMHLVEHQFDESSCEFSWEKKLDRLKL